MRRILGVVALVAALHVVAMAQFPGERPQPTTLQYPRAELFGGGSYGYTDIFNSGFRDGLYGWNASLALNAAKYLGFVADGSGFYGNSRIPVTIHDPFPPCTPFCPPGTTTFNVKTRVYSYLFGIQVPWRRPDHRVTPFAEALFGRSATRGTVPGFAEVSSGLGLVGGGGADYEISPRFALRFKADYFQTSMFNKKQDNLRVSVGLVIRTVHRKKRRLEEENPPEETPPATNPAPPATPPPANPPQS